MKKRIFLAALLLLTGCAHVIEPKTFTGPNGKQAYLMNCGYETLQQCYEMAVKLCPGGYSVVGQHARTVVVPLATGGSVGATKHDLAVECK